MNIYRKFEDKNYLVKLESALDKSIEKILDEENWTKEELARDKDGNPCEPRSSKAVKWCAIGSVTSVEEDNDIIWSLDGMLMEAVEEDSGYMGTSSDTAKYPTLTYFNYFNDDEATHEDVIGLMSKVLEDLRSKIASL